MTLGGLALAVGILVDDATVEIENTNRNLAMGKPVIRAILDGAQQIATPAFVATLAICIVFVPVVFITGVAEVPLHAARRGRRVRDAGELLPLAHGRADHGAVSAARRGASARARRRGHRHRRWPHLGGAPELSTGASSGSASGYQRVARVGARAPPRVVTGTFAAFVTVSLGLFWLIGMDFFPTVDAGQLRLHVRCPAGTRIEESARFARRRDGDPRDDPGGRDRHRDRQHRPPGRRRESRVQRRIAGVVRRRRHPDRAQARARFDARAYAEQLRKRLAERFPDLVVFFQPADIVAQILNFGLPAPIDVQIVGRDPQNVGIAEDLVRRIAAVPGAADVRLQQVPRYPEFDVDVDRRLAHQLGFTECERRAEPAGIALGNGAGAAELLARTHRLA